MSFSVKLKQWARLTVPDAIWMFFDNRELKRQLKSWETAPEFDDIRALNTDVLENYIESEWSRAKELDEKLNKLTAALSIAVTLGGVVSKTIFDGLATTPLKTCIMTLLFLSMIMFLSGAVIGFSGLRPKPRYGYGAKYLRVIANGGNDAEKAMREAACGFQIMNNIRSNEASTAIGLIRNGVVVFSVTIAISFFAPTSNGKNEIFSTSTMEDPSIQRPVLLPKTPINSPTMDATKSSSIQDNSSTVQEAISSHKESNQTVVNEHRQVQHSRPQNKSLHGK